MSVLGFAGGEIGSTAELANVSGITMETGIVHGGKYSYRVSNGGSGYFIFAAHTTPIYFRGYFYSVPGHTNYTQLLSVADAALGMLAVISLYAPGQPAIMQLNSGTQFWQGTTVFPEGVWYRLEFGMSTSGYFELRVNGRQEIVRSDFIAASPMAAIMISATTPAAGNIIWDDLHVTEDGFPGPGFVIARQGRPGTPTFDAFTKTGGTIDQCWSDTPVAIGTNAVSAAVSQNQTMLVEALSQVPIAGKYGAQAIAAQDTVFSAAIYANGHRVGSGPDHYIIRANAGVITRSGPHNFTTLDTYRTTGIFAASLTQLDAMEIGGARGDIATALSNLLINDMWLVASYAKAPVPIRHFTGFEAGTLGEVGGFAGTVTIDTAQVRSGVYALKAVGPAAYFILHPDPIEVPNLWVRGYVYLSGLPTALVTVCIIADPTTTNECDLYLLPDGRAQLAVGGMIATTPTPAFVVGAWNYFEVFKRASIVPGDGVAAAWVNNQTLSIPIVDTNGVSATVYLGMRTSTLTMWFDDLLLSETGRIGPGRVLARQGLLGAVAQNNAWIETGGTIDVVWSNTPSNPATYSQAPGTSGAQGMVVDPRANGGVFLGPTDTIIACRVVAMARYDTGVFGGPTSLRIRLPRPELGLLTQVTLVKDTPVVITSTTSRLVYGEVFAAVLGHINAIQIGGVQGATGPSIMRIEDIWLMVAYADLQVLDLPLPSTPAPVAIVEIEL